MTDPWTEPLIDPLAERLPHPLIEPMAHPMTDPLIQTRTDALMDAGSLPRPLPPLDVPFILKNRKQNPRPAHGVPGMNGGRE